MQDTSKKEIDSVTDETYKNVAKCQKLPLLSKNLWTAFITVFISGIVIGAVSIQIFMDRKIKRYFLPEHIKMRILSRMTEELNLSPAQRRDADQIITKMTKEIAKIRRSQAPKIQSIVQSSFADVSQLLNAEQKIKLIAMQEKVHLCQGRNRGVSARGLRQPTCNNMTPQEEKRQRREDISHQKSTQHLQVGEKSERKE